MENKEKTKTKMDNTTKFCRGCSGTLIDEEWIRRCCELCGDNLYFCSECADQSEPSYFYDSICWGKEIEKSLNEEKENNKRKRLSKKPNSNVLKRRITTPAVLAPVTFNPPVVEKSVTIACRVTSNASEDWKEKWRGEEIVPLPLETAEKMTIDLTKEEKMPPLEPIVTPTEETRDIICNHCKKSLIPLDIMNQRFNHLPDICSSCKGIQKESIKVSTVDFSSITLETSTIMDIREKFHKMAARQNELRDIILRLQEEMVANEKDCKAFVKFLDYVDK